MSIELSSGFRAKEYKGCDIRAASYKSGAQDWTPQACFWIHTENGPRRVWTTSFAHCFGLQGFAFKSKIEADNCAFRMAQTLIDKTLPELQHNPPRLSSPGTYISKILAFVRRSRLRRLRSTN